MARIPAGQLRAEPLACAPGLPCASCWDLAPGPAGTLSAVCTPNDLLHWDGKEVVRGRPPALLPLASMVVRGADGALWLAHEEKVVRTLNGVTTRVSAQEALTGKRVLHQGRRGKMWIAADD